jgi:hypothetical protein
MLTLRTTLAAVLLTVSLPAAETLDLAGAWRLALDPQDQGRSERWFARELAAQTLKLPGSLQDARLGDPITVGTKWTGGIFDRAYYTAPEYEPYRRPGNIKVPFWLQPETHYTGAAWYQRAIEIPATWSGRRVSLMLERPHWTTTVWVDDREIGSNDANSVAHVYNLGANLAPGRHTLTIRVDNRLDPDIGENSHSVSDHTQGNWNGIVGRIELTGRAVAWIEDLEVHPRFADRVASVRGRVARVESQPWPKTVRLASESATRPSVDIPVATDGTFAGDYVFGDKAAPWDEFTPTLHTITASGENGESASAVFGFRHIATQGRQLMLNGRPLFLRGTLDCAAFPRTGHPPTDLAEWKRVLGVVKAHGLNHVRFHSWCPPEAAFAAADELGVYFQVEVASWPNWSTTLGDGKPVDAWIEAETARILQAYGNHPSFVMLCAGNEPGGDNYATWLAGWVARNKAADPRRLYSAGAGWPEIPANDYHVLFEPRIQHWGAGLASRINGLPPETRSDYGDYIRARTVPVVSHEIGQWCVYPNFGEMPKYTGYLKPRNFEIFQESLAAHGMSEQARAFFIASGKLQTLCYKEDIESALRTPEMGGFQLLSLQDFPGQGTALVGVLDAFWEDKGYVTPAEFRRFCHSTVPLARLDKRVFTADEHLTAMVEVAHYGASPIRAATARWQLVGDGGGVVAKGEFPRKDVPTGLSDLGRIDAPLGSVPAPARYRLVVTIADPAAAAAGHTAENDWDIWVYPKAGLVNVASPAALHLATTLDPVTQQKLAAGGTVFLMIPPDRVAPDAKRGPVALGFSSIFWNTAWTNGQAPHTLGILCDPKHLALAAFPTDAHSNWHWWYPIKEAAPLILDGLPRELRPVVQVVDDWVTNRKLGLVFEARVGQGKLLVTSIDLQDAVLDPVRRQLRASLFAYAASEKFQPSVEVAAEQIRGLFKAESK